MPQLENGYIRIATELVEQFCKYKFTGQEWQVLWVIIRKTYGWQKKYDKISYGQIATLTGIQRRTVIRLVNNLVLAGSVKKDTTNPITLSFVKDYDKWKVVSKKTPSVKKDTNLVTKKTPLLVSKKTPTIDTTIDTKQKIQPLWDYFLVKTKKNFRLTDSNKRILETAIKNYTIDQLRYVVDRFIEDDWVGRNEHLDLIYCMGKQKGKPDNIEKWLNKKSKKPKEHILSE